MTIDDGILWAQIGTKGYLHIKNFLSDAELQWLRNDYAVQSAKQRTNGNYDAPNVTQMMTWSLEKKMRGVCDAVRTAASVNVDMPVTGLYFAIERGVDFKWHQDHESFYTFQQHYDYLNFYIPIVKPDPHRSNVCLIPFDRLHAAVPEYAPKLVGSGAKTFFIRDNRTIVLDDEVGGEHVLDVNFEDLKEIPALGEGDLLLMRGDMIHRTQDTQTERIAASLRRTKSMAVVNRTRFESRCPAKIEMMQKHPEYYAKVLECYDESGQSEMTARQLFSLIIKKQMQQRA